MAVIQLTPLRLGGAAGVVHAAGVDAGGDEEYAAAGIQRDTDAAIAQRKAW